MSDDSGVGRTLEPTKFDVNKFRRSDVTPPKNVTTPDQFGQQYNADADRSKWSSEAPQDSRRYHTRADTDLGPRALHHTLGSSRNQASPGDHIHDGVTSRKLGPLEMDPANNGKTRPALVLPANATAAQIVQFLHNFIEFRES